LVRLVGGLFLYWHWTNYRDLAHWTQAALEHVETLPVDARVVFVFGGSQPVRRLNAAVAGALPRLVERFHVVHVTGDYGYAEAVANQAQLPPDVRDRYRPYRFLGEEMLAALAAADLVVGRAGSSTLAEVSRAETRPRPPDSGLFGNSTTAVPTFARMRRTSQATPRRTRVSPPVPAMKSAGCSTGL